MNTKLDSPAAIVAELIRAPFAWPGGYERFAVTDDGGTLCHKCVKECANEIRHADPGDGWYADGIGCSAEMDGPVFCDHCYGCIVPCWECEQEDCYGDCAGEGS